MNNNEVSTRQLYFDKKYDFDYNYSYLSLKNEIKTYKKDDELGKFIDFTQSSIEKYNQYNNGYIIKGCYLCFIYKGERYYTMYDYEEVYDMINFIKNILEKLGCTHIYFVEGELD